MAIPTHFQVTNHSSALVTFKIIGGLSGTGAKMIQAVLWEVIRCLFCCKKPSQGWMELMTLGWLLRWIFCPPKLCLVCDKHSFGIVKTCPLSNRGKVNYTSPISTMVEVETGKRRLSELRKGSNFFRRQFYHIWVLYNACSFSNI